MSGSIADIIIFRPVAKVMVDGGIVELGRCIVIVKDRHIDLHFAPSPGSDVGGQGGKADVRIGNLIRQELGS